MTDERDRFPLIAGVVMIVIAVAIAIYAFFWPGAGAPAAKVRNVDDLERALASAKRACVNGPPQNASCAEAARLTAEIAQARSAR